MTAPYPVLASAFHYAFGLAYVAGTQLHVLDHEANKVRSSQPTASVLHHVAVSTDGSQIVTASDDKSLTVWNAADLSVRSVRRMAKKVVCLTIKDDDTEPPVSHIFVTDVTGDLYSYPWEPRAVDESKPKDPILQADPAQNPDADLLLGHVSTVTTHHHHRSDEGYIFTADRDGHVRLSCYPHTYVIEKYLYMAKDHYTSAMTFVDNDVLEDTLITGGDDGDLHFWDCGDGQEVHKWKTADAILPHRRVRPKPRRSRGRPQSNSAVGKPSEDPTDESWYSAPEGFQLPLGRAISINSVVFDVNDTGGGHNWAPFVAFTSQGAAALFSVDIPDDGGVHATDTPRVNALALPYPVLGFIGLALKNGIERYLVFLDTAWGVLKNNDGETGAQPTEAQLAEMMKTAAVVVDYSDPEEEAEDEDESDEESAPRGFVISEDQSWAQAIGASLPTGDASAVAKLQLYQNLSLLPRWAGMEEDDEAPEDAGGDGGKKKKGKGDDKVPTQEELEKMGLRQLGHLKARGIDVGSLTSRKKRKLAAGEADGDNASEAGTDAAPGVAE